jgi:excisionase family DNA binding protein
MTDPPANVPDITSNATDRDGRCFSVRTLARYWRCSPARVRELARRQILRAFKVGRSLRFSPAAVHEAEALLTPTLPQGRRPRRDSGISPRVEALLGLG